jgi:hypothetical protein
MYDGNHNHDIWYSLNTRVCVPVRIPAWGVTCPQRLCRQRITVNCVWDLSSAERYSQWIHCQWLVLSHQLNVILPSVCSKRCPHRNSVYIPSCLHSSHMSLSFIIASISYANSTGWLVRSTNSPIYNIPHCSHHRRIVWIAHNQCARFLLWAVDQNIKLKKILNDESVNYIFEGILYLV